MSSSGLITKKFQNMTKDNKKQKLSDSTGTAIDYSTGYAQPYIALHNCDNSALMADMEDESVDVILTDPPYLYLKNQKLEREFDEEHFFKECYRVLTKNGFIVMFGRGTSFYRWNTILDDLGFTFKEEIIWNKSHCTSPLMVLSRVHETISIFTKGKGTINKVKVPYLEMKGHDIESIIGDVKRMRSILKNTKSLNAVLEFLEKNSAPIKDFCEGGVTHSSVSKPHREVSVMKSIRNGLNEKSIIRNCLNEKSKVHIYEGGAERKHNYKNNVVASPGLRNGDRCAYVMSNVVDGLNEKSIIRTDRTECDTFTKFEVNADKRQTGDRCVNVMQSVEFGLNEKSIIKQVRDHYSAIHPTQKPVRLLERLLALVIPKEKEREDIVVADFFGGSFSTMEAVFNMGMKGISCEIDKEYFEAGKERIEKLQPRQMELFD